MWVRQCELDAQVDETLPIPARIASNDGSMPFRRILSMTLSRLFSRLEMCSIGL